MPLWEKPIDRERELFAMNVLEKHFNISFSQTAPRSSIDFYSKSPGYVCEHKFRNYSLVALKRMGSIYLEKTKYDALLAAQKKRGDAALFVVSSSCGKILYCDIKNVSTKEMVIAKRREYRGPGDDDKCYLAMLESFICAN